MIRIDIEKRLKTNQDGQQLKVVIDLADGSITKIHGPSGAGKTTFLKIIAGFIKPDKGVIKVNHAAWTDVEQNIFLPPQKRMAGFVFQDYALFPNMTVHEHLEYACNDEQWIQRLLSTGKLESVAAHRPEYLSGGQQQRLAILRALAIKPKLLLMDEPFSALDAATKTHLINDLKVIFNELGATVLIVSHNQQELAGVAGNELMIG